MSTLTGLVVTPGSGEVKAGQILTLTLTFSSDVTVTQGTDFPSLQLSNGVIAHYSAQPAPNSVDFTYTVLAGDNASGVRVSALNLNGGNILDAATATSADTTNLSTIAASSTAVTLDTTPPVITMAVTPAANVDAANANGAVVDFSATATDNLDPAPAVSYTEGVNSVASHQNFAFGHHDITATATDAAGNTAIQHIVFDVKDLTPPTLTLGSTPTASVEASSSAGAVVNFTATATDSVDPAPIITYTESGTPVAPGSTFGFGAHDIVATANDAAGNVSTGQHITFTVQDTTAPTLTLGSTPTAPVEASSSAGAVVNFAATAADAVDPAPSVTYTENGTPVAPGDTFAIGTHDVVATATDASSNVSAPQHIVFTVQDATPPTLTLAAAPTAPVEAASADGAVVDFAVAVTDSVDPAPVVAFTENGTPVAPGDTFAIGTHDLVATATDASSNVSAPQHIVFTVQDTTPPTLTIDSAPDAPVEATSPDGAAVDFAASATDTVDGIDPVSFTEGTQSVAPGDIFAAGHHQILARAQDQAGNATTRSINFDVVDHLAPDAPEITTDGTVTKTATQTITGTGEAGSSVQLYRDNVLDGSPVTVSADGSWSADVTLTPGTQSFTATDTDPSGNVSEPSAPVNLTLYTDVDPVTHEALPVIDLNQNEDFAITNSAVGLSGGSTGHAYTGPLNLDHELIWNGTQSVAVKATAPNVFLHGGSGDDALQVTAGNNVLDGGAGSNFLVGATVSGSSDSFFVDARSEAPTWSTVVNFHAGDQLAIWGFAPGTSQQHWVGQAGASGFTGATLRAQVGGHDSSVTFAGLSDSQANGLTLRTDTIQGQDYLLITRPN